MIRNWQNELIEIGAVKMDDDFNEVTGISLMLCLIMEKWILILSN